MTQSVDTTGEIRPIVHKKEESLWVTWHNKITKAKTPKHGLNYGVVAEIGVQRNELVEDNQSRKHKPTFL